MTVSVADLRYVLCKKEKLPRELDIKLGHGIRRSAARLRLKMYVNCGLLHDYVCRPCWVHSSHLMRCAQDTVSWYRFYHQKYFLLFDFVQTPIKCWLIPFIFAVKIIIEAKMREYLIVKILIIPAFCSVSDVWLVCNRALRFWLCVIVQAQNYQQQICWWDWIMLPNFTKRLPETIHAHRPASQCPCEHSFHSPTLLETGQGEGLITNKLWLWECCSIWIAVPYHWHNTTS